MINSISSKVSIVPLIFLFIKAIFKRNYVFSYEKTLLFFYRYRALIFHFRLPFVTLHLPNLGTLPCKEIIGGYRNLTNVVQIKQFYTEVIFVKYLSLNTVPNLAVYQNFQYASRAKKCDKNVNAKIVLSERKTAIDIK